MKARLQGLAIVVVGALAAGLLGGCPDGKSGKVWEPPNPVPSTTPFPPQNGPGR